MLKLSHVLKRFARQALPEKKTSFVLVTGADSTHYLSLRQCLDSLLLHECGTPIIVYDLGLSPDQAAVIKRISSDNSSLTYRVFDFSQYPDYVNIRMFSGQYAWKPIIFFEILSEFRSTTCWMDAGNVIHGQLSDLRKVVRKHGIYTPLSKGIIREWTHPGTCEHMSASNQLMDQRNRNGACVAVDYDCKEAFDLARKWRELALKKECIAPEGSNRTNHRQDQSILSILFYQCTFDTTCGREYLGFSTHQDIDG